MDFEFDAEQRSLRDAVRGLLRTAYDTIDGRRTATADDPGYDEAMWRRLAEMGLLGLPFREEYGGMGAGPAEVAIVAEEIGRVLAPEPFVEAVVLAGGLVAAAGSESQCTRLLPSIAEGAVLPAVAHYEPGSRWGSPRLMTATGSGDDWVLNGVKEPVLNGARADLLVVTASLPDELGTALFLVDADANGLARTGYRTFDGGRAAKVSFDGTPATPLGEPGVDARAALDQVFAHAQVAYCHEALGAMDVALAMTTNYLRTRTQFGVPLKTFQALTFRAADMYVSLELARSMALWATLILQDGDDVVQAAARAKLQLSIAGRHIGKEAIQLHGGIGMTAEYAVGHYATRLTAIDHLLGDGTDHRTYLASSVADHGVVDVLS